MQASKSEHRTSLNKIKYITHHKHITFIHIEFQLKYDRSQTRATKIMKLSVAALTLLSQSVIVATAFTFHAHSQHARPSIRQHRHRQNGNGVLSAVPPRGGLSFEEDTEEVTSAGKEPSSAASNPSASASESTS